jgi:signal transduction histidine kinase
MFVARLYIILCISFNLFCLANNKTDSLLKVISHSKQDTNLVKIYTQLAWQYYGASDTINPSACLGKSLQLSEKLHFNKGILDSYSNLAMLYTAYGKSDSAVHYLALCLKRSKSIHDLNVASKCAINLANAYLNQANYAEAIRYYIEALNYFEVLKDQEKIAMTDHCLGIAYYLMKNYSLSLDYYQRSIDIGQKLGKPEGAGYSYNGMGVVHKEMQEYDTALYYLDQSFQLAVKANDQSLLSHNLSNIGEIYSLRHNDEKALEYLEKALALQTELNDQRGLAETHNLTGDVYLRKSDYAKARTAFESAKSIAAQTGLTDILKNAWKGLSSAYRGLNDYPGSLEAYQQYSDIKDSLYTAESTKQIADMQTKYDTEKKERENLLLQQKNKIDNLQLSKEKTQKYILVGSLLFVLLFGGIFYNRYRLKQKNDLLKEREFRIREVFRAQENEKIKLSKDLHDGVGALLSLIKLNISGIDPGGPHDQLLANTKDLAGQALKEVRNVSHNLMPGLLSRAGLEAALAELTEQVNSSSGINMKLNYRVKEKLTPEAELNIFRMVQEGIHNMIKYASATEAAIVLIQDQETVVVTIKDNGCGFDRAIVKDIAGNGLNNIISRAHLLKGEANIATELNAGTTITVTLSLKHITYV